MSLVLGKRRETWGLKWKKKFFYGQCVTCCSSGQEPEREIRSLFHECKSGVSPFRLMALMLISEPLPPSHWAVPWLATAAERPSTDGIMETEFLSHILALLSPTAGLRHTAGQLSSLAACIELQLLTSPLRKHPDICIQRPTPPPSAPLTTSETGLFCTWFNPPHGQMVLSLTLINPQWCSLLRCDGLDGDLNANNG